MFVTQLVKACSENVVLNFDYNQKYDILKHETKIVKGRASQVPSVVTIDPEHQMDKYSFIDFSLSNMLALGIVPNDVVNQPANNFDIIDKLEK